MKSRMLLLVLTAVAAVSGQVSAEVYDAFDGSQTWAYSSTFATSPNGKWTYTYWNNPSYHPIDEFGTLKMYSNYSPGHDVRSTQSWALPTNPNESLIIEVRVTNAVFNASDMDLRDTSLNLLGASGDAEFVATTASDATWKLYDMSNGYTNTGIQIPFDQQWDMIRFTFSMDGAGTKSYTAEFADHAGSPLGAFTNVYTTTSDSIYIRLYTGNTGNSEWEYVSVTSIVPEPTTLGLLAVGGILALRRKK